MGLNQIKFQVHTKGEVRDEVIAISTAIIAGWTGRDKEALEKHILELEELGVKRPASTPIYYRVSASRVTISSEIEASGHDSSGEVEFVVIAAHGRTYLGVGSDHTDRTVETYNITVSKQMCDKPIAPMLWDIEDVADHWDSLILRSWIIENGEKTLYQEGSVTSMLPPTDIIRGYGEPTLKDGSIMYCGTLAAKGGIRPADRMEYEIEDPVLGRKISHGYDILPLAIAG